MSSVNSIRLPGLATGMDTETMVKQMLTGEQNKIDRVNQKQQTIQWQQEIYRDVMTSIKDFQDKFFSLTSSNSILTSNAWNAITVISTNPNAITATSTVGSNKIDYDFEVTKLAQSASVTSVKIASSDTKLGTISEFKADSFFLDLGEKDINGNSVRLEINITADDTPKSLSEKIQKATNGKIIASYSEMTGKLTIETKEVGSNATFKIVDKDGNGSNALEFIGIKGSTGIPGEEIVNVFQGSKTSIKVTSRDKSISEIIEKDSNSFMIDGISYSVKSIGTTTITSKQDVQPIVDKMKAFVDEYNKIIDKVYNLVLQKKNLAFPPLTEAQKEEMSEDEISKWETKAKEGLLRNDNEMRRFMEDMESAIFGDKMAVLDSMGLKSQENYNKRGQLYLDETKFTAALQTNSEDVYALFAKGTGSVLENMKTTMYKYVGTSSSIFAQKAGLENTASVVNNFYSNQLKAQSEIIKNLQRKMDDKEEALYKKFAQLEASMNKFNSQMNYLGGVTMQ